MTKLRCACLILLLVPALLVQARPMSGPGTVQAQVMADDGHSLTVWSRVPAQPRGSILLVHGLTWSSLPNFDLQVPGEAPDSRSVLAALAQAGYAAYAVDLRGYGGTARERDGWNTPARAEQDVLQALAWIAAQHPQLPPPVLLGYSNGAAVAMLVAQDHPGALSTLVLYGFPDDVDAPDPIKPEPTAPAPRDANTAAAAAEDFITAGAAPDAVRDAYVAQALAADPVHARWRSMGQFSYRPEQVHIPVLQIRGVNDPISTQVQNAHLYARLGSQDRTWVTLPHADHMALVEDSHTAWMQAIVAFLQRSR